MASTMSGTFSLGKFSYIGQVTPCRSERSFLLGQKYYFVRLRTSLGFFCELINATELFYLWCRMSPEMKLPHVLHLLCQVKGLCSFDWWEMFVKYTLHEQTGCLYKNHGEIHKRLEEEVVMDDTCAGRHVLLLTWSTAVMLTLAR